MDKSLVEEIAARVIAELNLKGGAPAAAPYKPCGVFEDVDEAVAASKAAQPKWHAVPREKKTDIINALRKTMHQYAEDFSRRALEETGMGRLADKIAKHHNAADASPGLEDLETKSWSGDKGLVIEEYAPYGVVAAITPSTHPVPVLFNSLVTIIASGNTVVFNVHPAAKHVSAYAVEIFNDTIRKAGGPDHVATMIKEPTLEGANQLFHHKDIPLIVATGGPALVKAAFQAGKKVVAAGPGNPPVLVDDSCCSGNAAEYIIEGASFDNNILCIAEKEVFVLESIFDKFMGRMEEKGAVRLNSMQIDQLTQKVFQSNDKGGLTVNREFIGKNAAVLGAAVGLHLSDDVRLLFGETDFNHPFVQEEQMMPFIPLVRVASIEEGIRLCVEAEHGYGHTAMIHSTDVDTITAFTKAVDTDIVVANGSCLAGNGGGGGEAYFSHTIASPTGEGICTPRDYARVRRLVIHKKLQIH